MSGHWYAVIMAGGRGTRFWPKSRRDSAKQGNFFWNAGMFFWRASTVLELMRRHQPKIATLLAGLPRFNGRQESSRANYVDASKPVALLGVENLIMVDTADALLVANRSRLQEVGKIVKALEARRRDELL
jgi:mannose-1-phosphate guanylyltransferase